MSLAARRYVFALANRMRNFFGGRFGLLIDVAIARCNLARPEHAAAGERAAEMVPPADVAAENARANEEFSRNIFESSETESSHRTEETSFGGESCRANASGLTDSGLDVEADNPAGERPQRGEGLDSVLVWVSLVFIYFFAMND